MEGSQRIRYSLRQKIPLNGLLYKIGLRLARIKFVRHAIDERADLREFRKPPTIRILLGMFLIAFSFVMCWPAISVLGGVALYFHKPLILAIGGPTLYISSHGCFLLGMALSGEKYTRIFFKWMMRCHVEWLLRFGVVEEEAMFGKTRNPNDE
jgi:hypothetical protein